MSCIWTEHVWVDICAISQKGCRFKQVATSHSLCVHLLHNPHTHTHRLKWQRSDWAWPLLKGTWKDSRRHRWLFLSRGRRLSRVFSVAFKRDIILACQSQVQSRDFKLHWDAPQIAFLHRLIIMLYTKVTGARGKWGGRPKTMEEGYNECVPSVLPLPLEH